MQDLAKLLPFLCCPMCHASLFEENGRLRCADCGTSYPLREGIPHFVPPEFESAEMREYDVNALHDPSSPTSCGYYVVRNFEIIRDVVLGFAEKADGGVAADLGCGLGFVSKELTKGRTVIGVDFSANCIREAARRGLLTVQANISRVPIKDRCVDLALCTEVAQHFDDFSAPLFEFRRILKPGGRLILSGLNGESLIRRIRRRIIKKSPHLFPLPRLHSLSIYRERLQKAGFEIEQIKLIFFPARFIWRTENPNKWLRLLATGYVFLAARD